MEDAWGSRLIELATEIVSAYVAHNAVPASDLPTLMKTIHTALDRMQDGPAPEPVVEPQAPAVPIRKSVTDDYIVCLEDGRKFKSLKRHLQAAYGLTPEQYRAKWDLPRDYPMVAPAYANKRSELARKIGLGRKVEG
ncbi:MucR family transcriptional regulator [Lichenibacterium ramalinae]|uniref:MucR family transcriptional regulator n=1 Tax=Lichenibacterium ramalinae TaxID=2316527 RepID=A0A4Q2RFH0_9HYPH|nr:MucR family transcriptional regulator [Lichenibacterium ramalinae]RYB05629.1 MucR family transcriptional regulator [Lichenibacterium ramalinae]